MREMKADLTTLKEGLTSLNETVIQLSGDLEMYKNWTMSELADLQTSIDSVPDAALLTLLPYLNDIEENLFTDLSSLISDRATSINESMGSFRGDLEMYKNWTMSELADLQTSIDSVPDTALLKLLPYMNNTEENLLSSISDRATSIDASVSSLSGDLEMYKNRTMSELADLQTSIDSVPDAALLKLLPYMSNTEENLLTDLSSLISDRATSIDASVSSLSGDLEMYKNQTTHVLSGDLGWHINQTASGLAHLHSSVDSLRAVNREMRDDIIWVKADLGTLNDSMSDIIEKTVTTDLDHNLTQILSHLLENTYGYRTSPPVHTCGDTGGWRRVVYLDMTNPKNDCPSGWNETGYSKRTCGRSRDDPHTCDTVTIPVSGGIYSQVCGRIKAYQWGVTWGFHNRQTTVDDAYFTGVAVMHGSPRQHIWTFAAGLLENYTLEFSSLCPCDTTFNISIPPFVGEDYFCESGYVYPGYTDTESFYALHSNDTLWDGRDCHSSSRCCSHRNPPYFTKTLSMPTTDDIDLRMCFSTVSQFNQYVDIAVELVELYVKN